MKAHNGTKTIKEVVQMLKVVIPESKAKIQRQIEALEYALSQDTRENDKEIHTEAIKALKEALEALEAVENAPSPAGRKKVIDFESIQRLKEEGYTQELTARELNISISTVKRNWK
jgi:HPt (histidine-containing phosphotransfer) domain-containing protein